jgi:hypothetical protein
MSTANLSFPYVPSSPAIQAAVAALRNIGAEAQSAAAALQRLATPPIFVDPIAFGTPPVTRGLTVLNPNEFPDGGPTAPQPAPRPTGSGVPFTAEELAALRTVSTLIKATTPQLSNPDKTVAAQAQRNLGILSAYVTGMFEAHGQIPVGTFVSKISSQGAGGDVASQATQLSDALDSFLADPQPTRIIPFLVGVIVGMAISTYLNS